MIRSHRAICHKTCVCKNLGLIIYASLPEAGMAPGHRSFQVNNCFIKNEIKAATGAELGCWVVLPPPNPTFCHYRHFLGTTERKECPGWILTAHFTHLCEASKQKSQKLSADPQESPVPPLQLHQKLQGETRPGRGAASAGLLWVITIMLVPFLKIQFCKPVEEQY